MRADVTIGSLFSGIGGLELGLEWAGLGPVVWQCEIDPFCRAILAKHWPNATRFVDVTQPREWPPVDLVCGGFPCQDVSSAGNGRGLGGARSGLWYYFARVVRAVRPRVVVVENVASGAKRWLRPVRHQLHMLGYRTRALGVAASDVGAPHRRARVFVVADAGREHRLLQPGRRSGADGTDTPIALGDGSARVGDALLERRSRTEGDGDEGRAESPPRGWWTSEPAMGRVVDGVSGGLAGRHRRQRLRVLGNAVVPQCAQVVGEVIAHSLALARQARRDEGTP